MQNVIADICYNYIVGKTYMATAPASILTLLSAF